MPRILILDIETAPNIAYVWRYYKENIGAKQVLEHSTIMSFAAKWLGDDNIIYCDGRVFDETRILKELIYVLDLADIVIAHNGSKFDLPTIQGRAMVAGFKPPSPYKVIDTRTVAKYEFNFPSNSLEYLSDILGVDKKDNHKKFPGFELWAECLKGNEEAWDEMREYNIQDVVTLEQVYLKMRPWMRRHPNVAILKEGQRCSCPKCGSDSVQYRGYITTNTYRYRKFVCNDCGGWSRSRFNTLPTKVGRNLLVNTA